MRDPDYQHLYRTVLAALVREDPMGLADPANDLVEEYESEAREIARRLVRSGGAHDQSAVAETVAQVSETSFGEPLSRDWVGRVADAVVASTVMRGGAEAIREQLWGHWIDLSGLVVRDGAVRIPVSRPVHAGRWRETAAERPDRVLVIEGATSVEVRDPQRYPWFQEFDGLRIDASEAGVRVSGILEAEAIIRGSADAMRVRIERISSSHGDDAVRGGRPVVIHEPEGGTRQFPDVDAARWAFAERGCRPGTHRGHDVDGHGVTITVSDISGALRRRARLRRHFGPELRAVSVVSGERIEADGPSSAPTDDAE